jgi:hypothetical protein
VAFDLVQFWENHAAVMEPLQQSVSVDSKHHHKNKGNPSFPKRYLVYAAMFIAMIYIIAQAMNYTGSTLAGPTVFAILYSSVGIWTALYTARFDHYCGWVKNNIGRVQGIRRSQKFTLF